MKPFNRSCDVRFMRQRIMNSNSHEYTHTHCDRHCIIASMKVTTIHITIETKIERIDKIFTYISNVPQTYRNGIANITNCKITTTIFSVPRAVFFLFINENTSISAMMQYMDTILLTNDDKRSNSNNKRGKNVRFLFLFKE